MFVESALLLQQRMRRWIGYRSLVRLDGFCQPGLVLRSGSDDKVNRLAPGKLLLLKQWVF